jgi:TaqI-like C-terminal specificity domain
MFEEAWVDTTVFLAIPREPLVKWPRIESCRVSLKTFDKRERILTQDDFKDGTTEVDIADWFRDGSDEFLTRSAPRFLELLFKLKAASVPFGECADIQRGVTPFALTDKPVHPNSRQAFSGTVRRYTLDPGPERFIRFDDSLAEFKPARYFTGSRLLLRELISRQMRLQATFTDHDLITNKSMQTLLPVSGGPDIMLLLGVLNSRLISWLFLQQSNVDHRDDFPKIVLKETRELPFPKHGLAEDSNGKLRAKEIAALVNRILRAKQADVAADTSALEREIDERIYRLYGLTPDEVRLVEEAAPSSGRGA